MKKILYIIFATILIWISSMSSVFAEVEGVSISSTSIENPILYNWKIYANDNNYFYSFTGSDLTLSSRKNIPSLSSSSLYSVSYNYYGDIWDSTSITDYVNHPSKQLYVYQRAKYFQKLVARCSTTAYWINLPGREIVVRNRITWSEQVITSITETSPEAFTWSYDIWTDSFTFTKKNGTLRVNPTRVSNLSCGYSTIITLNYTAMNGYFSWASWIPSTLTGSVTYSSYLPAGVKAVTNSQSAIYGSYTYYTVWTGSSAEIWRKLTTWGWDIKFVSWNADSPIVSNGFLIYKNITRGNKLYTIDLTASCVWTYPVGSQLSNTAPSSITQYQNTNAGGFCYYQIPTSCVNTITNANPVTNTGGYLWTVSVQTSNPSWACYQSCLTGYIGSSCNQFSEPFENKQEVRSINMYTNYWYQYNGDLSKITWNVLSNPWESWIYVSWNNVIWTSQVYRVTNKGSVAYSLFSNGILKELNLKNWSVIREINLYNFIPSGTLVTNYSYPFVLSSDDKRLYWISYEGWYYYINKLDLSTFTNQKFIKSSSSFYAIKENKDWNYLFYNNTSMLLFKKAVVNTDMNDGWVQFLNLTYASYQINFSADWNSLLFSYWNSIYKKLISDTNYLNYGTNISNNKTYVYQNFSIKETPDSSKIIYVDGSLFLNIFDVSTQINTQTSMRVMNSIAWREKIMITSDSKYLIYQSTSWYYYINKIWIGGIWISLGSPTYSSNFSNGYYFDLLPLNPKYSYVSVFQGEEVFEKDKVEEATRVEKSTINRETKDISLYSTGGIFGETKFLFFLNANPIDLNTQWFVNNQNQSVFKIKIWNKSVIIKLKREEE